MQTASELASTLDRKIMSARLDVGLTAISQAVVKGHFPSSWFIVMSEIAAERGVECPTDLFSFRTAETKAEHVADT